jgi:glycosyltransferase involved in cell wall biosynthesis
LFRALHEAYGIRVVAAAKPPAKHGLNLVDLEKEPFFVPADIRFPSPDNPFAAEIPVPRILETLRPRTVISEFSMRQSTAWQLPAARLRRRIETLIFWTHGWQMDRGFRTPADMMSQFGRLVPFGFADTVATYTEEGARWVRRCLPWKSVHALGNTLDVEAIRATARTATPVRHGSPQLLAVGRMTADKAFDVAIDAFEQVVRRFPEAALTIIGEGDEREKLRVRAGARLGHSIRLPGALYGEAELAPHFLGADAYVLAGAAGLSVNHALAYALPVVAFARSTRGPYHHPEIEYVIDGVSGLLLPTGGAAELGAAIAEAHADGRLTAMRSRMAEQPTVPTIADIVERFGRLPGIV